jgi:hypothetical protein
MCYVLVEVRVRPATPLLVEDAWVIDIDHIAFIFVYKNIT